MEITRALVTSPKYILLDEPFAGIDPLAVADIQKIIEKLKDQRESVSLFPIIMSEKLFPAAIGPTLSMRERCLLKAIRKPSPK